MTPQQKLNALNNTIHSRVAAAEGTEFKLVQHVHRQGRSVAIVETAAGDVLGIFLSSATAISAIADALELFGKDQPMVRLVIKEVKGVAGNTSRYELEAV